MEKLSRAETPHVRNSDIFENSFAFSWRDDHDAIVCVTWRRVGNPHHAYVHVTLIEYVNTNYVYCLARENESTEK